MSYGAIFLLGAVFEVIGQMRNKNLDWAIVWPIGILIVVMPLYEYRPDGFFPFLGVLLVAFVVFAIGAIIANVIWRWLR